MTVIPITMTTKTDSSQLTHKLTSADDPDDAADNLIVGEVTSKHRLRPGYLPPPQMKVSQSQPQSQVTQQSQSQSDNAPIIRSSAASISLQAGSYAARPFSPTKNLRQLTTADGNPGWQHRRFSKWITRPSEDQDTVVSPLKRMAGTINKTEPSRAVGQQLTTADGNSSSRPLRRQTSHIESGRRLSYIPGQSVASWSLPSSAPPPFSPPPPLPAATADANSATADGNSATADAAQQRRAILPYGGAKSDGLINKHAFVTCNIIAAADRKKRESYSRSTTAEITIPGHTDGRDGHTDGHSSGHSEL